MSQNILLISSVIGFVIMSALFAFAKSLSKSLSLLTIKNISLLILISLINIILLLAVIVTVNDLFVKYWLFSGIYLVFGIVNFILMHHRFMPSPDEKKFPYLFAEIFFSAGIMLFITIVTSLIIFHFISKGFLFYPMMLSVLMFMVPQFFLYTFNAAVDVPDTDFNLWEYPVSKPIDPPGESLNENLIMIVFNISKKVYEKKTIFQAKVPENIILGELFYYFINEYNEEKRETPIEYLDENKEPMVWWFRLKRKWYQFNTVLDPSLGMRDNLIKENSVVICEQLIKTPDSNKDKVPARELM